MNTLIMLAVLGQWGPGPRTYVPYNTALGGEVIHSYTRQGSGWFAPANPGVKTINLKIGLMERPGYTGRVVEVDEDRHLILIALPLSTQWLRYSEKTRWRHADPDTWPVITKGALINADPSTGTITVLQ